MGCLGTSLESFQLSLMAVMFLNTSFFKFIVIIQVWAKVWTLFFPTTSTSFPRPLLCFLASNVSQKNKFQYLLLCLPDATKGIPPWHPFCCTCHLPSFLKVLRNIVFNTPLYHLKSFLMSGKKLTCSAWLCVDLYNPSQKNQYPEQNQNRTFFTTNNFIKYPHSQEGVLV